jgi:hypothetical protein
METKTTTRDLGVAAALVSVGFKISSTQKDKEGRTSFIFSYKDDDQRAVDVEVAIDNYWSNHLQVDASKYFDAIKMLKSRIYSEL